MNWEGLERRREESQIISRICFLSGRDWHEIKPDIEHEAYLLWINDGMVEGRELDFWLQAERKYLDKLINTEEQ